MQACELTNQSDKIKMGNGMGLIDIDPKTEKTKRMETGGLNTPEVPHEIAMRLGC